MASTQTSFETAPLKPRSDLTHSSSQHNGWAQGDDSLIFSLCKQSGSSWSQVAQHFPGKTEEDIKNRFYSTMKRLVSQNLERLNKENESPEVNKANVNNINEEVTQVSNQGETANQDQESGSQGSKRMCVEQQEVPDKVNEFVAQKNGGKTSKSQTKEKIEEEEGNDDKDFENFLVYQNFPSLGSTPTRPGDDTEEEADIDNGLKVIQNAIFSYSQQKTKTEDTSPCKSEDMSSNENILVKEEPSSEASMNLAPFSGKLVFPVAQKPSIGSHTIFNPVAKRVSDNNSSFPQRIVEECLAKRMNEGERVNNLIQILKDFPEQNEANKSQKLDLSRSIYKIDQSAKNAVLAKMHQAIQCISVVHSNYVKYVMGIAKEVQNGDSAEMDKKIEYLFHQLELLKGVVLSIRNRIVSLEQTVRFINKQNIKAEDVKIEETECETPKLEQASTGPNVVTIKIGSINPGFENIVKKRILG